MKGCIQMQKMLSLTLGDPFEDGHGKTSTHIFKVTSPGDTDPIDHIKQLEEDIKQKFNLDIENWFVEYEENYIPNDDVQKLVELGIVNQGDVEDNHKYEIWGVDWYTSIWMQLLKKADPNIEIEEVKFEQIESKCEGYGLFL